MFFELEGEIFDGATGDYEADYNDAVLELEEAAELDGEDFDLDLEDDW